MRPSRCEIDLDAVAANVRHLREVIAPAELWAVVKADAYGHGAVSVARTALDAGASGLCVALDSEGVALRSAGIAAPILVLSQPTTMDVVATAGLEPTVYRPDGVAAASSSGIRRVHLKVDTGMHRVGAQPHEVVDLARYIVERGLLLASMWTHLAVADDPADPFTDVQLDRFDTAVTAVRESGIEVPITHVANSAAALVHPRARRSMARCGIALYGLSPGPRIGPAAAKLRPAMRVVSQVAHVKVVERGEGISYGRRFRVEQPVRVATIPLGYADGIDRRAFEVGLEVLIGGRRRPILGTVTMDQFMVAVDDSVRIGDEVVLIGNQGDVEINADEWAVKLGTINYEIVCRFSARMPRLDLRK